MLIDGASNPVAWLGLLACLAVAGGVFWPAAGHAQEPMEQEVMNFRLPEYDAAGMLKSQIFGDRAKIARDGVITIDNLRMEFYEGSATNIHLWAERCVYDRQGGAVSSDTAVRVVHDGMVMTGIGLRWSTNDPRVHILADVKLVVSGGPS